MKRIAIALSILLAAAADASAIARYDIGSMSCARVKGIIQSEGAAILRYRSQHNPALTLYDRFVSDGRYCQSGEIATRTGVPTADSNYCPLRKCIQNEIFDLR
jgi:hypothetical protein